MHARGAYSAPTLHRALQVYSNIRRFKDDLSKYKPDYFVCVPLVLDTLHSKVGGGGRRGSCAEAARQLHWRGMRCPSVVGRHGTWHATPSFTLPSVFLTAGQWLMPSHYMQLRTACPRDAARYAQEPLMSITAVEYRYHATKIDGKHVLNKPPLPPPPGCALASTIVPTIA
eukprot:359525-Chlamydomonas_euryale.AAC.1